MTLADDLRALGVASGGVLMVHAAMRAVGGRAEALIEALLSVLGPTGTLMAYVDFEVTAEVPVFDPSRSPAATGYGVFPEILRRWDGAVRSHNPGASMVAVGGRADWICRDHPIRYGYGPGSPLAKLVEADGHVLLLGSDLDQVTLLHYAEHVARLPDKRVVTHAVRTGSGELHVEEFDTSEGVITSMPDRYFAELTRDFLASDAARSGTVGDARSHLLPASAFARFAVEKMERRFTPDRGA